MPAFAYIRILLSQERCPCCGSERLSCAESPAGTARPIATARFFCGAHFEANYEAVSVSSPCRAGSDLAAKLMTIEVKGKLDR